jgi:DNA excision repair protein ERCC-2
MQAVRLFLPFNEFNIIMQQPDMSEKDRTEVLQRLAATGKQSTLLMAVSGGIFSEGIDYPGEMAVGAFVVSPNLPALSPEQELLREYYNSTRGMGFEYAYLYPGMNKVVQAAGRVIRTPNDRGVILLLGERFAEPRYANLFPEYWYDRRREDLSSNDPVESVRRFWKRTEDRMTRGHIDSVQQGDRVG